MNRNEQRDQLAWLEESNQYISDIIDWIEEQQALALVFPTDPYLIEISEMEMN